jgi:hypothetical protein
MERTPQWGHETWSERWPRTVVTLRDSCNHAYASLDDFRTTNQVCAPAH